jgi:hypothetical protein
MAQQVHIAVPVISKMAELFREARVAFGGILPTTLSIQKKRVDQSRWTTEQLKKAK